MRQTNFKNYILCTIFLTGLHGHSAQAATITATTPGPFSVVDGDSLTITSTGSLSNIGPGIDFTEINAGFFNNQGSIASVDTSVAITAITPGTGSHLSGGITNSGVIANVNNGAVVIENASTVNGNILNTGTIYSMNGNALLMQNNDVVVTGNIINSGTMSSDNDVAVVIRNSAVLNGNISNTGTIQGLAVYSGAMVNGSITNGSVINGNNNGLEIYNGSNVRDNLTNNGTITGNNGNGLVVQYGGSVLGNIVNNNSITGSQAGFYTYSSGAPIGSITNALGATMTGNGAEGLYTFASTITNGVFNHGTITGATDGAFFGSTIQNQLTNTGTIEGLAGNGAVFSNYSTSGNILNSGTVRGATNGMRLLSGGGTYGTFTNTGSIIGQNGNGFFLDSGGQVAGNFTNDTSGIIQGSINGIRTNSGSFYANFTNNGSIIGQTGSGMYMQYGGGNFGDNFVNNGSITGQTNGFYFNSNNINGDIINNGTVAGTTGDGFHFDSYGMSGALINNGTITGDVGFFTTSGSISGGLYNNTGGTIIGTSGRAITFGYGQKLYLNGGTIVGDVVDATSRSSSGSSIVQVDKDFTAQGDFYVGDFIVSSGTTMNTAGYGLDTLNLQNNGRLEIGAGSTVTAETVQVGTGNYVFELSGNQSGQLVTTNPLDLTGSTISVKIGAAPTATSYLIIDSASPITGGPGAVPTAVTGSYLWAFNMVDGTVGGSDASDIYLQLAQANSLPTTGNAGAVSAVIGNLATSNTQLQAIQTAINNAPTAAALNTILSSTMPIVSYASVTAANNVTVNTANLINTRLTDLSSYGGVSRSGIASGDISRDAHFWVQAFGQRGNQGLRASSAGTFEGYDVNTYGTTIGLDSDTLVKNSTVGASFTYANTDVNGLTNADMDIDSYQLSLYGQHNLQNDMFLRGIAAYTFNDISTERRNIGGVPGLNAFGDYNANQLSTNLSAGRDYKLNNTLVGSPLVTPTVLVNYLHYMPNSYTETGAGGANLSVDGNSMDMLEFGVNLQSKWDWNLANGALLQPSVQAGYRYDVIGDNIQTTSSFTGGGATFATQGITPAQSTLNGGFGLTYQQSEQVSFTANYNYEKKSDYNAHAAILRMKYSF
jgi:uncharacterized protein with beta-barrel porin domain